MNRTSISLARIVALNVPRSWQEVVAVVLEAGHAMKQSGTPWTMEQSFISAAGGLQIHASGWPSGSTADALARLLQTLLAGQMVPAELRALMEPGAASAKDIDELMKALAYFERPNRQADIAALATRAMALDAQAAADSEIERLRSETPTWAGSAPASETRPSSARRLAIVGLAVLLLVALAAAAAWYVNRPAVTAVSDAAAPTESTPPAESAAPAESAVPAGTAAPTGPAAAAGSASTADGPPSPEPASPTSTFGSLVSAASEALTSVADAGLRAIGLAPSEPSPAAPSAAPSTAPPGKTRRARPPAAPSTAIATAVEPTPGSVPLTPPAVAELPVLIAEPDESALAPEVPPGPFTDADADVEPPVLVYPQLPSEPQPNPPASVPHFELLVNERGEVDQVRLRSTDARLEDRMMVSAAKAWRFRPATKDGKPVRYRVRVPIPR